jgi:hypothetical protein
VYTEDGTSDYNEQTLMEAVTKRVAATPGPRLRQIMTSLVNHLHGSVPEVRPTWEELLAGPVLNFWEASSDGFYDLQRPNGPNLRARLRTDASGQFGLRAVRPVSYPVPTEGPVGAMLQATNRHAMRSAHLHFTISAPGHERLVTQLFVKGDPYLDSDAVFGVKESCFIVCTTTLCPSLPRHDAAA